MSSICGRSLLSFVRMNVDHVCCHHSRNIISLNLISRSTTTTSSSSLKTTNRFNSLASLFSSLPRARTIIFLSPKKTYSSWTNKPNDNLLKTIRKSSNQSKIRTTNNVGASEEWTKFQQMGLIQKYKYMFLKYWYVAIPVHFATSVMWFGSLYVAARSGVDVKPILRFIKPYVEKLPLPDVIKKPLTNTEEATSSAVGYIAITLVMYKLVTLLRYATTVGATGYAIKILLQKGIIKPLPSSDKIKQVFRDSGLNAALKERIRKNQAKKMKKKNGSTKTTKK